MAKLSAHGYELARITLERPITSDSTADRERVIRSYRSDGHIMLRRVVHFPGRTYDEWHDYGWKLHKKYRPEVCKDRDALLSSVKRAVERAETVAADEPTRGAGVEITVDASRLVRDHVPGPVDAPPPHQLRLT